MQVTKAVAKAAAFLKQKKYRELTGEFLVEGLRNAEEAVDSGLTKRIFYIPDADSRQKNLLERAARGGIELYEVSPLQMRQIGDTDNPQGVVAVCSKAGCTLKGLLASGRMLLVLDRVQDPGNMGTMIRTGDAAGVGGVVALTGTVDAYNPKVVRSAMGSLFHIPVVENVSEEEFLAGAVEYGYLTAATAMSGGESIYEVQPPAPLALIVGNEANGVSAGLLQAADRRFFIPMKGRAESLNAAVAAGIMLFQLNR